MKTEKVAQVPSKAPFSKRFEDAVGKPAERGGTPGGRQVGLATSTTGRLRRTRLNVAAIANPELPSFDQNLHY